MKTTIITNEMETYYKTNKTKMKVKILLGVSDRSHAWLPYNFGSVYHGRTRNQGQSPPGIQHRGVAQITSKTEPLKFDSPIL